MGDSAICGGWWPPCTRMWSVRCSKWRGRRLVVLVTAARTLPLFNPCCSSNTCRGRTREFLLCVKPGLYIGLFQFWFRAQFLCSEFCKFWFWVIGVGSGAAGAALAAPIFCLVAVLGPRYFSIRQFFVLKPRHRIFAHSLCSRMLFKLFYH